jgi:hypothetical protein
MHKHFPLAAGLLCLIGGCAADDDASPPSQAEREQALRESAFGTLVEPMDRAAGVEQLQLERKRDLDAALERDQGH